MRNAPGHRCVGVLVLCDVSVGPGYGELGEFDECVPVAVVRDRLEAGDRAVGMLPSQLRGVAERTRGFDGLTDVLEILDAAFLDGAAYQAGLGFGALAHGVDQRQGRFAFGQVVADVLAEGLGVALVIQQIVDQLEGNAQVVAKYPRSA